MLDLKAIRAEPEGVRAALARRGEAAVAALDRALELDERRRALLPELERLRAEKNAASKRIGELQREGGDASEAIAEVRAVSEREKQLDAELRQVQAELDAALAALPNPPDETRRRPRTRCCARWARPVRRDATTSSCSATSWTSRPARVWPARASPTSRARW